MSLPGGHRDRNWLRDENVEAMGEHEVPRKYEQPNICKLNKQRGVQSRLRKGIFEGEVERGQG